MSSRASVKNLSGWRGIVQRDWSGFSINGTGGDWTPLNSETECSQAPLKLDCSGSLACRQARRIPAKQDWRPHCVLYDKSHPKVAFAIAVSCFFN
jgi:hypothetical protein